LSEKIRDFAVIKYVNKKLSPKDKILVIRGYDNFYYYNAIMTNIYQYSKYSYGLLFCSDLAEKDIILFMDSLRENNINYIIVDLDDLYAGKALTSKEYTLSRIKKIKLFGVRHYNLYKIDYNSASYNEIVYENVVYDFIQNLSSADIKSSCDFIDTKKTIKSVSSFYVCIGDEVYISLLEHPESVIEYKLRIPEDAYLRFKVGISDEMRQHGDGVIAEIRILWDGRQSSVFKKFVRPSQNKWASYSINMAPLRNKEVRMQFRTYPGEKGDAACDWFVWAEPRLVKIVRN